MFRQPAGQLKEPREKSAEKTDWTDDGKRARHKEPATSNSWSVKNANANYTLLSAQSEAQDGPRSRVRKMDTRRLRRFDTQRMYMRMFRKPALIALSMFAWIIPAYLLTHASQVNALTSAYQPLLGAALKTASVVAPPDSPVAKLPAAGAKTTKKHSKPWPQRHHGHGR